MGTLTTPVAAGLRSHSMTTSVAAAAIPIGCCLMLLIGVSLAVVPSSVFFDLPRDVIVWSTFTVLLVLALSGYQAARSAGQCPWIAPISLITIYYFFRYGIGAVVAQYWEDYPWERYPILRWNFHRFGVWEFLPAGCQLMIVFGIGMLLGSLLALSNKRSALPRFSWPFSESRLKRVAIIYAPPAAFINSFLQFELPLSIKFTVGLFGSFIYLLIMLGGYWLFTAKTAHERLKWMLFLIGCCALTVPVGLITGQVNGLLMPGVCVILGYIIAKGAPPWKAIGIALPLIFFVLLPFSSIYKSSGAVAPDIGQRLENTVKRFGEVGYRGRLELALERTMLRFSGANMPSIYAKFWPNVFSFEYGKSFEIEASTIVPRVLWPEKPFAAFELNRYPARLGMVAYEGNTTALFDAISEYYLNVGTLGMFALAIVHGYYWQAIYKWLTLHVHPLIGAAMILRLVVLNEDFYGVGLLFTAQIKTVPVWLLLFYLFSRAPRPKHS